MRIKSLEEYHLEKYNFEENPENFWEEKAKKFVWYKKWEEVLNWDFNSAKVEWFVVSTETKGFPSRSPPGQKPKLIRFNVPSQFGKDRRIAAVMSPALL